MNKILKDQVSLLIQILPVIAGETDIALHGGTAINLFIREMPRLSVDIDLTYLPLESRDISLNNIKLILNRVKSKLISIIPEILIKGPEEFTSEYY
jgi:predicted nucleotidyltransferase component of viral defense system